jgi:hypothetical protein
VARRIMKTHCANLLEAQEGAIEALRRSLKGNADPNRIRKKSAYWSRYWVISHVA